MIVMFSRSGSTLKSLILKYPQLKNEIKLVITNNKSFIGNNEFLDIPLKYLNTKDIELYLSNIPTTNIILMGYMRIISKDNCEKHNIYNLHPADIIKHPNLKGKDPIERFFENNTDTDENFELGCVIHKAIAEVDSGEILLLKNYIAQNYDDAVIKSQSIAIEMWYEFINNQIIKTEK